MMSRTNQRLIKILLFQFALLFVSNLGARTHGASNGINLQNYALPQNSIRAKLDSIFQGKRRIRALKQDPSWVDFGSWHWLVGKLTTDDGTEFVIKTSRYKMGTSIPNPDILFPSQTHTAQQNISRIRKTAEVEKIIKSKKLTNIRVPKCWVYPISGNDEDLSKESITDRDVIIVEEMINIASDKQEFCLLVNANVQAEALRLSKETFDQLVTLVKKGKVVDLHPKNILVDKEGKVVLIDLEDIISQKREKADKNNYLLRLIRRFKLKHHEKGSAILCVAITGLCNKQDTSIKLQGVKLMAKGLISLGIKKNALEIGAITTIASSALAGPALIALLWHD